MLVSPNCADTQQKKFGLVLQDLRELGANFTTLRVRTFVGYTMLLLDNVHHTEELHQMGVNPATAFACGVDFLLRIRPEALAPFAEELRALSDPKTLKIGIQIRVGDATLVGGNGGGSGKPLETLERFTAFFDCAAQIEDGRRRLPAQHVLYYLISDSTRLRRLAAEAMGGKLLTSTDAPVQHSREGQQGGVVGGGGGRGGSTSPKPSRAEVVRAFQAAAAEMWLFALTNYQVISLHSGYGRFGAFASGRFHQVYAIDLAKDATAAAANRSCGVLAYASMEYVSPESDGLVATGL